MYTMKASYLVFPVLLILLQESSVLARSLDEEDHVVFRLYSKTVNGVELSNDDLQLIDPKASLVMITHGWNVSAHHKSIMKLVEAFLKKDNYNVITVDWLKMQVWSYDRAASKIPFVANIVTKFLKQLSNKANVNLQNAHLVGSSYGAHIMGSAARNLADKYRVGRITGLDPANEFFLKNKEDMLAVGDADLVVVIHTSDFAGNPLKCGDIDFYMNDIMNGQPACVSSKDLDFCSHNKAKWYFIEAVENKNAFLAKRCDGESDGKKQITIGGDLQKSDAGKYCVETNAKPPYSKSR